MTEQDFRNSIKFRGELAKVMETPALLQALAIIKAEHDGADAAEDAPEIVSVRKLSARTAVEKAIAALFRMTTTLPKPPAEPKMDFGTGIDADTFDDLLQPQNK